MDTTGRRVDAVRHRARILQAATTVLAADPRAGLLAVAAEAGLTRTTMYAHFATRGALVEAIVATAVDEAVRDWDARGPYPTAIEALEAHLRASWQTFSAQAPLLAAAHDALGPQRADELHRPLVQRVRALVVRGRAEGLLADVADPGWLVQVWVALVHAAGLRVRQPGVDPAGVADELVGSVRRAFGA